LGGGFPLLRRGTAFFLGASSSDDEEDSSESAASPLAILFFGGGLFRFGGGARFFAGTGFDFLRGIAFFLGASSSSLLLLSDEEPPPLAFTFIRALAPRPVAALDFPGLIFGSIANFDGDLRLSGQMQPFGPWHRLREHSSLEFSESACDPPRLGASAASSLEDSPLEELWGATRRLGGMALASGRFFYNISVKYLIGVGLFARRLVRA